MGEQATRQHERGRSRLLGSGLLRSTWKHKGPRVRGHRKASKSPAFPRRTREGQGNCVCGESLGQRLLKRLIQPLRYVFGDVICDPQAIGIAALALFYLFGKYGCSMGVLQSDIEGKRSCAQEESQWPGGRA